jgi:serine/threonine protein kinase
MNEISKTEPDWEKVVEIFEAVLELSPYEREQFLKISCGADARLRNEVEGLLAADSEASGFIETPAVAASSLSLFEEKLNGTETAQTGAFLNEKIGAFQLVREIGRGGMGTVYLAERTDGEFQQRAAIKLIRRGMDTNSVVRRFREERQILANIDHPFIARLLDGGTTQEGLPYLVMEYVEGDGLLDYCERNNLTIKRRLKLFEKVCEAVVYAHAQNVLHRDLKPNNILVKPDETVKLLDFGIAKLHNSDASGQTFDEGFATRWLMTPEYASPEQIKGES